MFNNSKSRNLLAFSVFIILLLGSAASAGLEKQSDACYSKSSSCSACYILPSDIQLSSLPDSITQCAIADTQLNLKLNNNQQKIELNIFYLSILGQNEINQYSLNQIAISQDFSQTQQHKIVISNIYFDTEKEIFIATQEDSNKAIIDNAQFSFSNLQEVNISSISFIGSQIQKDSIIQIQQLNDFYLQNAIFQNHAIQNNSGGVITILKQSRATLNNTQFIQNELLCHQEVGLNRGGAAIYITDFSILACFDCSFVKKNVQNQRNGGAIVISNNSALQKCLNCQFTQNKAIKGGAVSLIQQSMFENCFKCSFDSNQCENKGGAIYLESSIAQQITKTTFSNNAQTLAKPQFVGGGALCINSSSIFRDSTNCLFKQNSAYKGGAVQVISTSNYSNSSNCIFTQNSASYGGAIVITAYSNYTNSSDCLFQKKYCFL